MPYIVKRDGVLVSGSEGLAGEGDVLHWLHQHCPSSASWALQYEGYSYEWVEDEELAALLADPVETALSFGQLVADSEKD